MPINYLHCQLKSLAVSNENFQELVQVASTIGNPGTALLEALHQVWAPTLLTSGVNLTCLKKLEEDILGRGLTSISLTEEEQYWKEKKKEENNNHTRKIIEQVIKNIKDIKVELESAATSRDGLNGVEEVMEIISGNVDDLWKLEGPIYTEEQMKTLLDIIGSEVVSLVQSLLDEQRSAITRVKDEAVGNAATICEKWVSICERLTRLFWPHLSLHTWRGPPFTPLRCSKFGNRLR